MFDDTEIDLLGSSRSPSRETTKANPDDSYRTRKKKPFFRTRLHTKSNDDKFEESLPHPRFSSVAQFNSVKHSVISCCE